MSESYMFQVLFSQYLTSVGKEYSNLLCARTNRCTHARAQWCTILWSTNSFTNRIAEMEISTYLSTSE